MCPRLWKGEDASSECSAFDNLKKAIKVPIPVRMFRPKLLTPSSGNCSRAVIHAVLHVRAYGRVTPTLLYFISKTLTRDYYGA